MKTYTINLPDVAHEMAQEEIGKQVSFLSQNLVNCRFLDEGKQIQFDAPEGEGEALSQQVATLASRIQRALKSLQRNVVFRSKAMDDPRFADNIDLSGVRFTGLGQVALSGLPLQLFVYFDRVFNGFGTPFRAEPIITPTLIADTVLARCDYFRSFPQYVTFASHLREDVHVIDGFRKRHQKEEQIDGQALGDMARPDACLSPAVCYHVYHLHQNTVIKPDGPVYGICGKCFRYESSNMKDLRRLWDFTMREVVFMGGREEVLRSRETSIEMMADFLENHELAGEIRTASDPFFIAPDAISKTYFQISADSKYEISLVLPNDERLAVGSHNYHSDFFGRAFDCSVEGAGPMHSVCVAFGLERWVHAFLQQHGSDPSRWPDVIRKAPEFAGFQ